MPILKDKGCKINSKKSFCFLALCVLLMIKLLSTNLLADGHIIVYHRFGDSRHPNTNTSTKALRLQFQYLKDNGYKVVKLDKMVEAVKSRKKIPDSWVAITIDDNYKSFYANGLKIFKEYKYPFTMFVYVKATDRGYSDFLTYEQLKEISKYGTLEFHSYSHPHLTQLSDKEIISDIKTGLDIFKKKIGNTPKYFSYPYGEYDDRVENVVKEFGFEAIFNQNSGAISSFSNIDNLDRVAFVGDDVNIKYYLGIKSLKAKWLEPKSYPKDGILKKIHVKTDETNQKQAQIYITGYGWENVKLDNGVVFLKENKKLTSQRVRLFIKIGNKQSSKLLVKSASSK